MESIFHLPNDIQSVADQQKDTIIFHHYHSLTGTFRSKSILHKNAISLVIRGEKTMHFANKTVSIREGEFHFLSTGNCIVTMDVPASKNIESILIFFENSVLADFFIKYDKKIKAFTTSNGPIKKELYVSIRKDAFVLQLIDSIKLLFQSGSKISMEMKSLKLEELLLHLLETCPSQLLSFSVSTPKEMEELEIRKTMETNFANKVSLDELAFLCNMSLSSFKRKFVKIYGLPPSRWLLQKRMERAQELLEKKGERPSDVFHKVGYENHSSFSQAYKQYFGHAPKDLLLKEGMISNSL
jgi:AraC-like DNA-binding protein